MVKMDDKEVKVTDQLLKELGIYAAIYGVAILIGKGLEFLKDKKK
jgi:hypothetical protein